MSTDMSTEPSTNLRLWPGVLLVVVQWLAVFGTGLVAPGSPLQFFGMMGGPLLGLVLFLGWWWWASRAPRDERWLGAWLPILAVVVTMFLVHKSMPQAFVIYGLPILCALFVSWAALTRGCSVSCRRGTLVGVVAAVCLLALLLRTSGVDGDMGAQFKPRWQKTPEEELVAQSEALPEPQATMPSQAKPDIESASTRTDLDAASDVQADPEASGVIAQAAPASDALVEPSTAADIAGVEAEAASTWAEFRGPSRDGAVRGTDVRTDWQARPPEPLWRRPIGPGWGSFAMADGRLYTQEQRGEDEVVSCYDADTGEPRWGHTDPVRFWEALAGAGPRATPTMDAGRVYALGATGLLNALDANTGVGLWQRDIVADTNATIPDWGFSSSPLVVGDVVVVHSGGANGEKAVIAYNARTGAPEWFAAAGTLSYSSVHRATIGGTEQLLIATNAGITALAPDDGTHLWRHEWPVPGGARIVQPAMVEGDVLLGTGFGMGVRRLNVTRNGDAWTAIERWTSTGLKPYFNDFVIHGQHAYGFDGRILAAIDLATGERVWKGGRYGNGQVLLLADQDLLLVLSDRGEVALVRARPETFEEVTRFQAIKGKTWNHPVLVNGVLYVRNGEEMAAYRVGAAL